MRAEASDRAEMVNQVLFGEQAQVLEERKDWLRVRLLHDQYEGWVDRKQLVLFQGEAYQEQAAVMTDMIEMIAQEETEEHFPIFLGSFLPSLNEAGHFKLGEEKFVFHGHASREKQSRAQLLEHAFKYLHSPYLWGGRSPFGIDCSGFTQMVYRLSGYSLPRDAYQQAKLGETLSFIEESEAGDLAFFDNKDGDITHVGLILEDNYIIHASGQVRIDRLDQSGIYNPVLRTHTHRLRVIKKVI